MTLLLLAAVILCPATAIIIVLFMTRAHTRDSRLIDGKFSRHIDAAVARNTILPFSTDKHPGHYH